MSVSVVYAILVTSLATFLSRFLFVGLKSRADVEKGVKHILADIIAKDKEVLSQMRQRYNS